MAGRKILIAKLVANCVFSSAAVGVAYAQKAAVTSGYVPKNGPKTCYEIHRALPSTRHGAEPLLHRGKGTTVEVPTRAIALRISISHR